MIVDECPNNTRKLLDYIKFINRVTDHVSYWSYLQLEPRGVFK